MSEELEQNINFKTEQCNKFAELVYKFCDSNKYEKSYSDHTIRNYKNDLISFAMWCDRLNIDPIDANYKNLRLYLAEMDSARYARTTINRRLSSLRSFYR